MNIEEIRAKKLVLEKDIEALCAEFTKDADVVIADMNAGLKWTESCGKPLATIKVVLESI